VAVVRQRVRLAAAAAGDRDRRRRQHLALGHVFVANMIGNAVFLGFALAGAGGLSLPASLVALAMGVQNAMARSLAVPDLTTTFLTLPLAIAAALLVATRLLAQVLSPA